MRASQDQRNSRQSLFEPYPEGSRVTWPFILPLLVLACFILGQLIAVIPAVELGLIDRDAFESYPYIHYMLVAPFVAVGTLIWLWVRYFERRSGTSLGLAPGPDEPRNIALCFH